jgi:hypothetical protein
MNRKEDVKALFFKYDKDMPERIHQISFNENDMAPYLVIMNKKDMELYIKKMHGF